MSDSIAYTTLIAAGLATASILLNRHIDGRPAAERSDGQTARWVIGGVLYTCIGAALMQWAWLPHLPTDWRIVPATFALLMAAFAASGLPMYLGDINRSWSHRRRAADRQALDDAKRTLDGGQQ